MRTRTGSTEYAVEYGPTRKWEVVRIRGIVDPFVGVVDEILGVYDTAEAAYAAVPDDATDVIGRLPE